MSCQSLWTWRTPNTSPSMTSLFSGENKNSCYAGKAWSQVIRKTVYAIYEQQRCRSACTFCADWSASLLFAARISVVAISCSFNLICSWAGHSSLTCSQNSKDRFSHDVAQLQGYLMRLNFFFIFAYWNWIQNDLKILKNQLSIYKAVAFIYGQFKSQAWCCQQRITLCATWMQTWFLTGKLRAMLCSAFWFLTVNCKFTLHYVDHCSSFCNWMNTW